MKLDEYKKAQSIQIEILAYRKLKSMLERDHVVITSGDKEPDDSISGVFAEIFGDEEKRKLDGKIKADVINMVQGKIGSLNTEFADIGVTKVAV